MTINPEVGHVLDAIFAPHVGILAIAVVVLVLVTALPSAIDWAYGFRRKRKKGSQKAA